MDYENVKQMVLQNVGISLLPSRFVQQEQLQGTLVTIDLSQGMFTRPTLLAYPAEKATDLRLASFIDWVIQHYDH
ncbi:LysR substrate-binding domain-containing protein [Brevibacillus laterosporus]|uniref:LysR substrate-binding domain-containing protein n=1 Tax=Brevibacillus laterosporus TaxID=1465 RepID=UPI003D1BC51C